MKNKKILWLFICILLIVCSILVMYKFISDKNTKIDSEDIKKTETRETIIDDKKDNEIQKEEDNKVIEPQKDEQLENKQEVENNGYYEISLIGEDEIYINVGEKYNELGAKAFDKDGNDVSNKISIQNEVDTTKKGEYMVIYSIGKSMVIRNVIVK